jgi:hypothetical protein
MLVAAPTTPPPPTAARRARRAAAGARLLAGADGVREALVVGDDDELEVLLFPARQHDGAQRLGQAGRVLRIQVGRRLVQRKDAAVEAEGLRQRQADDQAGQHLL